MLFPFRIWIRTVYEFIRWVTMLISRRIGIFTAPGCIEKTIQRFVRVCLSREYFVSVLAVVLWVEDGVIRARNCWETCYVNASRVVSISVCLCEESEIRQRTPSPPFL